MPPIWDLEVSDRMSTWTARGRRFKPGQFVLDSSTDPLAGAIAEDAKGVIFGITIAERPPTNVSDDTSQDGVSDEPEDTGENGQHGASQEPPSVESSAEAGSESAPLSDQGPDDVDGSSAPLTLLFPPPPAPVGPVTKDDLDAEKLKAAAQGLPCPTADETKCPASFKTEDTRDRHVSKFHKDWTPGAVLTPAEGVL